MSSKPITREQYIAKLEEDEGKKIEKISAFGNILNHCSRFREEKISTLDEFRRLFWCPKGPTGPHDEIDKLSNNTRNIGAILESAREDLDQCPKAYFEDREPVGPKRCFFLIEAGGRKEIYNGNHRAGGIIRKILQGSEFKEITSYVGVIE